MDEDSFRQDGVIEEVGERAGEEFVMKFERARLLAAGRDNFAADVVHVAFALDPSEYVARLS